MFEWFFYLIIMSVVVECFSFLLINEGSILNEMIWSKVQKYLYNTNLELLYRLSKCHYCLSFYIACVLGGLVFSYGLLYNVISILFIYRFSHYLYDLNELIVKKQFSNVSVIKE